MVASRKPFICWRAYRPSHRNTRGKKMCQIVMVAITTGTTTPQNATNLAKPVFSVNALPQTINTKAFTASCNAPAVTDRPTNVFVKLAMKKKLKPVAPDIAIQSF